MKLDTELLHGGACSERWDGATNPPVFQTTAYAYGTASELADVFAGRAPGHIYSRVSNPTNSALETKLAALEKGVGCVVTSSGMAAITAAITALTASGDEIVAAAGIFGGTASLFTRTLSRFGVKTVFADPTSAEAFAAAITPRTKLLFVESICNPSLDVPDFDGIAQLAKQAKIPFVVDNTVATPAIFRPGEFGADVVVHSTSKFINGHGTAIGGAIIDTGNFNWRQNGTEEIKQLAKRAGQMAFLALLRGVICRDLGCCAAPMNSFLMLGGLETLGMRIAKHRENTVKLIGWLKADGRARVRYPGMNDSASAARVSKYFCGNGGSLLTLSLGSRERCFKFIDSLMLAKNVANLGDTKTLVIHPASTIFAEFSQEERQRLGAGEDLIRVSVGVEDFEDIKNDFEQALAKVQGD